MEAIENEVAVIFDEVEAIINDSSESIERKKEAQLMIQRAIEKVAAEAVKERFVRMFEYITRTLRRYITTHRYENYRLSEKL